MAEKKTYEAMVGRAITDASFRSKLLADPRATVKTEGYQVTDEVLRKLEAIDSKAAEAAVSDLQSKLGDQKAAW